MEVYDITQLVIDTFIGLVPPSYRDNTWVQGIAILMAVGIPLYIINWVLLMPVRLVKEKFFK